MAKVIGLKKPTHKYFIAKALRLRCEEQRSGTEMNLFLQTGWIENFLNPIEPVL